MSRNIIPRGFESTAHPVFWEFVKPPAEITIDVAIKETTSTDCIEQTQVTSCPTDEADKHNQCPICLSCYAAPVTIVSCLHSFCMECLLLWYAKKIECPLCKTSGRLFVRGDMFSTYKNVRVFSIDSVDASGLFGDIRRAIDKHQDRFQPQVAAKRKVVTSNISSINAISSGSGSGCIGTTARKKLRTDQPVHLLSAHGVKSELQEVQLELSNAIAKLKKTDELIADCTNSMYS